MARQKQGIEANQGQLIHEIRKLTSRQFVYEDGWCGMVPFDGELTELQTGPPVPFAELTWREQADVLREFVPWNHYPERAWDDEYRIRENIAAGKQSEQWLEGTSLHESFRLLAEGKTPPVPKQSPEISQEELANALGVAGANTPGRKAKDGKVSLADLRHESQEQDKRAEDPRSKLRDIER